MQEHLLLLLLLLLKNVIDGSYRSENGHVSRLTGIQDIISFALMFLYALSHLFSYAKRYK